MGSQDGACPHSHQRPNTGQWVTGIASAAGTSARNFPGRAAVPGDFNFCSPAGCTWELNSSGGGEGKKRVKGNQRNQGFDAFLFEPRGLQSWAVMGEGLWCNSGVLLWDGAWTGVPSSHLCLGKPSQAPVCPLSCFGGQALPFVADCRRSMCF